MRTNMSRELDVIEGTIDGTKFRAAETGFTVLLATVGKEEISLVGELEGTIEKGALFLARGHWQDDRKHGRQFRFEVFEPRAPSTEDQMIARLKTYPGIGESTATRIVEQLGERTWEIMDRDIDLLRKIPGIGSKALAKIRAHHHKQSGPIAQVKNRLIAVKAPAYLAKAIHEKFGDDSIRMLENNPYQVASAVERFGFALAERFARSTGLDPTNRDRVEAGVIHTMRSLRGEGHCGMPQDDLEKAAAATLGVCRVTIDDAIELLVCSGSLRYTAGLLMLAGVDHVEARVARSILALARPVRVVWNSHAPDYLSPGQAEAMHAVARSGVTVLTGGPGTGKSTAVAAVLDMAELAGVPVSLCAPTGRAAKRLTETTGRAASTIHRLLRPIVGGKGFHHDASNPLPAGLVVVDEFSMVDLELADALLSALTQDHRLLIVGDVDQLPSVGPGNVLHDIIDAASSANIAVVRLEKVFRQDHGSTIVSNAHRLLEGLVPISDPAERGSAGQFYVLGASTPEAAHDKIVKMADVSIPAAYGIEPADVQVLSPVHRGPAGTEAFNAKLQVRHAGRHAESFWGPGGRRFCLGDRVMQTRNDYERNVFNGDVGFVCEFDDTFMTIDFDGALKRYKRYDAQALELAYAMTIHKSQGGEFPAVLVPVLRNNARMLTRNLLYTAITRARQLCVLVGHHDAIASAVTTMTTRRWTALSHRLKPKED